MKEDEGFVKGIFRGDGVEVMFFWVGKRLGWEIV